MNKETTATVADTERMEDPTKIYDDPVNDLQQGKTKNNKYTKNQKYKNCKNYKQKKNEKKNFKTTNHLNWKFELF